jgi:hypothetical protein
MDQPVERAKVTAEVWLTKGRYAVHSVASLIAILLVVSAGFAWFGPWLTMHVPQSEQLVTTIGSMTEFVPISPFAQFVLGLIAVWVLSLKY